jgi:hypothetical protein
VIYFIQNLQTHAVKIGVSDDPDSRLATLRTANCDPLVLLGMIPGDHSVEAALHKRFHFWRDRGEWFVGHMDFLVEIHDLIEKHRSPSRPSPGADPSAGFFWESDTVEGAKIWAHEILGRTHSESVVGLELAGYLFRIAPRLLHKGLERLGALVISTRPIYVCLPGRDGALGCKPFRCRCTDSRICTDR